MKNSVKSTLKSVIALSVISVVCVAVLVFGNAFIPKYKPSLDAKTAQLINGISPTGVDDAVVAENKDEYFQMLEIGDKTLDSFNKENGSSIRKSKVLAVYKVLKGLNEGTYVVEAQAIGYAAEIIMLTSFNADGTIMDTVVKSDSETAPQHNILDKEYFDKLRKYINGKTELEWGNKTSGIVAATGATSSYTGEAIVDVLNLSAVTVKHINDNGGKL